MNNGKICISVCAQTADELINQIKRAEKLADIIEIRFDCVPESELKAARRKISQLKCKKPFLVTFRPQEQGGKREITARERNCFWSSVGGNCWADLEEDIAGNNFQRLFDKRIGSFHDFSDAPENLDKIYQRLKAKNVDIVKIAVSAEDVADSIAVWKLLKKARKENEQIVPIAMGEAGKWTRVLGLAHGAPLVYAALEAGGETAPGQFSAQDLTEVYRVRELSAHSEIYGVIGNPVAHSLSPFMHNAAFRFHRLDAVYIPFQVENLDEFIKKFVKRETREIELNFRGFSVTIPHKQAIIKHLNFIDETARKIGAVNTVKIEGDKLYGFNTDAQGFIEPLQNAYGDLKGARAAIFGGGGAARGGVYALKKAGAKVTIFARNFEKAKNLAEEFEVEFNESLAADDERRFDDFDIVVNATPLGLKGAFEGETPAVAAQIENVKLVYDLIYNPLETEFIRQAQKANVPTLGGLSMLAAQGAEQFKIWTQLPAPVREMSAAALKRLK